LSRSPIVPSSYQIAGDPHMAALVDRAHMTHVSHDRVVLLIIHIRARARDL